MWMEHVFIFREKRIASKSGERVQKSGNSLHYGTDGFMKITGMEMIWNIYPVNTICP
jgi:hypothetical protein